MRNVGLIVKATRLCNLRCTYCHDWAAGPGQTMRLPVLAALVARALGDPEHGSVDFIWHGGETTLLPMDFYRRAIFLQQRLRRPGQSVRNIIQTNGTRLTDAWARFLAAYGFGVGISLDGPPHIHDRHRRTVSGRPTFADVEAGIAVLRRHGVDFTVLMVLGEEAVRAGARVTLEAMAALGVTRYSLLSVKPVNQPNARPGTPIAGYLDPQRTTAFLAELYDCWRERGDAAIDVRELRSVENRIRLGAAGSCTLAGGCLGSFYLVEPSGEVAHCDLFRGDDRYTLGHVEIDSFAAMRAGPAMAALRAEEAAAHERMRRCPEYAVCNGWCPHERYVSRRHHPGHRDECCGLRPLIEHIRTRLSAPWAAADPIGV
ncbi:radical SAM/SPASM domain-containing protein [Paractinoplanes brasiliensis]|uniref:Radical SAM core domain-containing protein n=1 Tax=Paractinoplanes brasiliensis TaxID=52695 RepID=A0A4R6JLG2_9ACTN|nr:radical SAM protein [Actinoplanes brasiliensis]TDO36969.1 uncharacterized protein C8E87_0561 [Actinoplanes brasiliensis]GID30492.1 radical SAM/SPASM domain-containing protein [Actinoplanes brasiliensis]